MKKTVILLLCVFTLLCLVPQNAFAKAENAFFVDAREAVLMSENGEVVFSQNGKEKRPIASMTKIMTLDCIYDALKDGNIKLTDDVVVSQRASSMGGSQIFLDANAVYKVEDLIKSIIICSANDSCVALAEHVAGSVESFVTKMNEKAKELGLVATHFENCTGLPVANQYSCAEDVGKMFCELITNKHYFSCADVWMQDFIHPSGRVTGMTNTNKLVKFYDGCDGGKTGFTNEAMFCLCATAKRGDTRLISVVVGAPDSKTRFAGVSSLFNYGFANFEAKTFLDVNSTLDKFAVVNGKSDTLTVKPGGKLVAFGKKGESFTMSITNTVVNAPVKNGDQVAVAQLLNEKGEVVSAVNLYATETVLQKSYIDIVKDLLK